MIVDMPSIDREHLAGHSLIALIPALAVFKKAFASGLDRHLVRSGAIGPGLHLAFNADAASKRGTGWRATASGYCRSSANLSLNTTGDALHLCVPVDSHLV